MSSDSQSELLKKREKSKKFLGFSTIDFQKAYRLSKILSTFDFPCAYTYAGGREKYPDSRRIGVSFLYGQSSDVIFYHFGIGRDRFGCRCGYVTEGNARAILEGRHGVFKGGVGCLYG